MRAASFSSLAELTLGTLRPDPPTEGDEPARMPPLKALELADEISQIEWNAEWHLPLDVSPHVSGVPPERPAEARAIPVVPPEGTTFLPTLMAIAINENVDWVGDWHLAQLKIESGDFQIAATAAGAKGGGGGGSAGGSGKGKPGGSTITDTTDGPGSGTATEVKLTWPALNPPSGDATLPTDTYFAQQWTLTGTYGGINVAGAWKNYTGQGIKIGIVDDGIDFNHSDLDDHYLSALDYDAVTGGRSALGSATEGHGTTVAGVAAAARDGSGVVGVAYDAGFAGFRISYSTGGPAELADALNHLVSSGMDVGNASWGYTTPYLDNFQSWTAPKTAILNDVAYGRDGLGINLVFAAGNNRPSGDNVNYHNFQNSPYVITVAATDDYGYVAPFSNPGAALLVSAPGSLHYTDDRAGTAGWSSGDYVTVAGTSYAAPVVSGVIALMLEANPLLGFRDVHEILVYSAKQTDKLNAGWDINGAHNWNGGGLHFSHDYGFGLVDATAAVRLAESWQTQSTYANMTSVSTSHTDNIKIPDGAGSLRSTIDFANSVDLDRVLVDLNITHARPSDLVVTLTSPSGTTAELVSHPANGTGTGIVFQASANNFWGEDSKGLWTLTVSDTSNGSMGTLNSWKLTALGDTPAVPTVYVYTNAFGSIGDPERSILHDTSGTATLNTAAVTSGSYIDLRPGWISTIAGRTLEIDSATIIKNAWAGDGNDTIVANHAGNTIQAGRGNDTIIAGEGADTLYGGPGSDVFEFNALGDNNDTIGDYSDGSDVIDFRILLASLGYSGSDPIADGWLSLTETVGGGTEFVVAPHNGQAALTVVGVVGVLPGAFQDGIDFWTISAHG